MKFAFIKRSALVFLTALFLGIAASACSSPQAAVPSSTSVPATGTAVSQAPMQPEGTQARPTPIPFTNPAPGWKTYENAGFGLRFQYPADWFGPDEYSSGPSLRLEVGSDKVYPYGTSPEDRTTTVKNSYSVVIQYTKNNNGWALDQYRKDQPWIEPFLKLLDQSDGAFIGDAKGTITRVRAVQAGKFKGVETLSVPAPGAGGEYFYIRQAVLLDENLNVLSILGTPNNVDSSAGSLPGAFQKIDDANTEKFRKIIATIVIQ